MATYLDGLNADRERQRRALKALIEQEAKTVRELQAEVETYAAVLDQMIMRLQVFRGIYGPTQQETMSAQVDVEESSKPHTTAVLNLATHQKILQATQEALIRLESGAAVDPSPPAENKLTVADILGE